MRVFRHLLAATLLLCTAAHAGPPGEVTFNISPQSMPEALNQFAHQSGYQLLFQSEVARDIIAPRIVGTFTPEAALKQLLINTGLSYRFINEHTITIRAAAASPANADMSTGVQDVRQAAAEELRLAQSDMSSPAKAGGEAAVERSDEHAPKSATPEIFVKDSRILNMDIRRSRDDVQPYVIFERSVIERSSATNLNEFFRDRLPMNTIAEAFSQTPNNTNGFSGINLRGLGVEQTLILVDGHRIASRSRTGVQSQPDINGIPLAAIERIEVLPTTASGIYGGSATGGVINIVLRRDYSGVETQLAYGSSFEGGGNERRMDVNAGFNLEGGMTNILLSGSYSDGNSLLAEDRDLVQRGRKHIMDNNPAGFLNAAPVLGSTTNIRSTAGNLVLKNGGGSFNAPTTFIPYNYAGFATDGVAALAANAGRYNLDLAGTAQQNGGGRREMINIPTIESLMAVVRRQFSSGVQAFLELNAANNSSAQASNPISGTFTIARTAPNNPFDQDIQVTTPVLGTDRTFVARMFSRRAVGGVIVKLPGEWQAGLDHAWSRNRYSASVPPGSLSAAATTAVRTGALDVLRDTNIFGVDFRQYLQRTQDFGPAYTTLQDTTLRMTGPLGWSLPGGMPTLSGLVEYRKESLGTYVQVSSTDRTTFYPRSQSVGSLYLEARAPLIAAQNHIPGVRLLELQFAIRGDDYASTGSNSTSLSNPRPRTDMKNGWSSIDPTIGLLYQPLSALTLRASYGTGFLPPALNQFVPSPVLTGFQATVTDPLRGNEAVGAIDLVGGGNPGLRPEQSESWSVGMVVTPPRVPGLRFAVDWTKIDKVDNITAIAAATDQTSFVDVLRYVPDRIVRGPNRVGDLPGWPGPVARIYETNINIARAQVEAYDIALDYTLDTSRLGTFGFSAMATRQIHSQTQLSPSAPLVDNIGLQFALKLKGNATLTWDYRQWSLAWTARQYDSYWLNRAHTIVANQGAASIEDQVYLDFFASYRVGGMPALAQSSSSAGWMHFLGNTTVQLGIKNILDRLPPVAVGGGSELYSSFGDPSTPTYRIGVKTSF